MVLVSLSMRSGKRGLSVLALSSRFDGRSQAANGPCRRELSVLALSSRFDGLDDSPFLLVVVLTFSTRSVESF